ncbi:MAG: dynamin family protein [Candidatus Bathyarchaeia archaeon]
MYYIKKYGAVRFDILQQLLYDTEKEGKMGSVIKEDKKRIIEDLKNVLLSLEELGKRLGMEDVDELRKVREELESPFSIVFVGEFNRGKSSIINALLGEDLLEVRNQPTTSAVYIIEYSDRSGTYDKITSHLYRIGFNTELLRDIRIVDTPGTESLKEEHEKILVDYLPKADMVFFVLDASQPLTKHELNLLNKIRSYGSKIVIIINKIDIATEQEIKEAEAYIKQSFEEYLGFVPEIVKVSARLETQKDPRSNFGELRDIMTKKLSDDEKMRLKMKRPIEIAHMFYKRYQEVIYKRKSEIENELKEHIKLEDVLTFHFNGIDRILEDALNKLDEGIHRFKDEVGEYIDHHIGLKALIFKNKEKIYKDLEERVLPRLPVRFDLLVENLQKAYEIILLNIEKDINEFLKRENRGDISKSLYEVKKDMKQDLENIAKNIAYFKKHIKEGVSFIGVGALLTGSAGMTPAAILGSAVIAQVVDAILLTGGLITIGFGIFKLNKYKKDIKSKVNEYLESFKLQFREVLMKITEDIKYGIRDKVLKPFEVIIYRIKQEKERYENLEKELGDIYQKIRKLESRKLESGVSYSS